MSNAKRIKVYLGIPSTGLRADLHTYIFEEIKERYGDKVELVYPAQCAFRIFHDFARNCIVDEFLNSDCDVLWFIDSDVVPPRHVMELVTNHWDKWQAAGAVYPIWMTPRGGADNSILFTAYKGVITNEMEHGFRMCEVPREGLDWVDAMATGCMFLKRSVFDNIPKPYFQFKYDPETCQMTKGEDLGFCLKLQKLGIKFFTDYSIVCKHYKNVCLLDMNNYATDWSNKKVLEYDAEVKTSTFKACQAAYQQGKIDAAKELRDAALGYKKSNEGLIIPGRLST